MVRGTWAGYEDSSAAHGVVSIIKRHNIRGPGFDTALGIDSGAAHGVVSLGTESRPDAVTRELQSFGPPGLQFDGIKMTSL